jgi:hypothetical protein
MQYERIFPDDEREAARLFLAGYRQISNKFGIVARIDVPDLVVALKKKMPDSSQEKWGRWMQEEHWRRCYSKDRLEHVDQSVMRHLRNMSDYRKHTTGIELVVVCVDNTGLETWFDKGIEYLVSRFEDSMVYVYDKFGQVQECLVGRFQVKTEA